MLAPAELGGRDSLLSCLPPMNWLGCVLLEYRNRFPSSVLLRPLRRLLCLPILRSAFCSSQLLLPLKINYFPSQCVGFSQQQWQVSVRRSKIVQQTHSSARALYGNACFLGARFCSRLVCHGPAVPKEGKGQDNTGQRGCHGNSLPRVVLVAC